MRGCFLLLLSSACAPPSASLARPLLLPIAITPNRAGVSLQLVTFGIDDGLEPPVLGPGGTVAAFEWSGRSVTFPAARELTVETSMPSGHVFVQVVGDAGVVETNRVRIDASTVVVPEPPDVPQLVPWSAGGSSVLIVAANFGSGRLVDTKGQELPPGSVRCERPQQEPLRAIAMECTVTRQAPLGTTGFGGTSVRALVQTPEGPVLTPAVVLP